jgi:hypothetical protein
MSMSNDIDISDLSADTQDAYAFYKQIQSFEQMLRAKAEQSHARGQWGAVSSLESACYYLYGAFGWLASDDVDIHHTSMGDNADDEAGLP